MIQIQYPYLMANMYITSVKLGTDEKESVTMITNDSNSKNQERISNCICNELCSGSVI